MRNRVLLFLSLILVVVGCNPYKDVKFESFKLSSFELESTSKASIVFTAIIDNPLETSISLLSIDGTLQKDYNPFAEISLQEKVVILPKTKEQVTVQVNILLVDPMALLSMGLNIGSWEIADFRSSANITLKLGSGGNKTFKFKDIPLDRLLNSFK